jgi:hypothetical protein
MVKGAVTKRLRGIIASPKDLAMLELLFIFSSSNGSMAIQRSSCHLHHGYTLFGCHAPLLAGDIVLRIIE